MAHERFLFPVGQALDRERLRGYVHPLVQDGGNDEGCVVHDDIGGVMVLNLVEPDKDEPTRSSLLMRARE